MGLPESGEILGIGRKAKLSPIQPRNPDAISGNCCCYHWGVGALTPVCRYDMILGYPGFLFFMTRGSNRGTTCTILHKVQL